MQQMSLARKALLVKQCKKAQQEAGPGVRVRCKVSSSQSNSKIKRFFEDNFTSVMEQRNFL